MNFKQFRSPANDHARMRNGRGSRGYQLQSKLGTTISLGRLEHLLTEIRTDSKRIKKGG